MPSLPATAGSLANSFSSCASEVSSALPSSPTSPVSAVSASPTALSISPSLLAQRSSRDFPGAVAPRCSNAACGRPSSAFVAQENQIGQRFLELPLTVARALRLLKDPRTQLPLLLQQRHLLQFLFQSLLFELSRLLLKLRQLRNLRLDLILLLLCLGQPLAVFPELAVCRVEARLVAPRFRAGSGPARA